MLGTDNSQLSRHPTTAVALVQSAELSDIIVESGEFGQEPKPARYGQAAGAGGRRRKLAGTKTISMPNRTQPTRHWWKSGGYEARVQRCAGSLPS